MQYSVSRHQKYISGRIRRQRFIAFALYGSIIFFIFLFLSSFILVALYSGSLPEPGKILRKEGFSTTFLDRDGKVIYEMFQDKNRIPVDFTDIPKYLRQATIAIEDKNFYKHSGYSTAGIVRAFINSIFRGRLQGGSTLTQQLVKNVLLTSQRSVTRKIKEFIIASEIERRYSKDQILEMYLNEAPYGGTFWGVASATKGYFDKNVKDLNLVESAFLAGLPQRPTYYSPFIGKTKAYIGRTKSVLRRMREDKYITREEEIKAVSLIEQMKFSQEKNAYSAPHFIFYVRDQVVDLLGDKVFSQGLKIKTTLSKEVQEEAEKINKEEIEKLKGLNATNGAIVVLDSKTSEILAMVGSYDYNNEEFGQFNTATALRQPGSAIKPITYALAFEKGFTADTLIMDLTTVFPKQGEKDYIPVNYDGKYRGPIQLRYALGNSINIPAVKLLAMVGIPDFLRKAFDMGLSSFEPTKANLKRFGLSITLGGGETKLIDLTNAYSVFSRGGVKKDYSSIIEIQDYKGHTIYKQTPSPEKRALSENVSYLISDILSDNLARQDVFGLRSYLNIPGKTVAAKTGTTNDKRDNWALGFTKDVTVGVWVGNNDNSAMNPKISSGATGASPIWYRMMKFLLKKYKDGFLGRPDNVKQIKINSYLGGLPHEGYPERQELFLNGTEPTSISKYYKKIKISKNTGKLANDVEIKKGEYDEKEFIVIGENDPVSTDGVNRWQEAINQWAAAQSDDKFKPPTETSDAKGDEVVVLINEPSDKATVTGNNISIKAKIASVVAIKKVTILVDGAEAKKFEEDKRDINETLNLTDGPHEINVTAEAINGRVGGSKVVIGVNSSFEISPTPTTSPDVTPTP